MSEKTNLNENEKVCFKPSVDIVGFLKIAYDGQHLDGTTFCLDKIKENPLFIVRGYANDKKGQTENGFVAFIPEQLPLKLIAVKVIHDHKTTSAREIAEMTGFSMSLVCTIFQEIDAAELQNIVLAA
jgi:hypothetical protein